MTEMTLNDAWISLAVINDKQVLTKMRESGCIPTNRASRQRDKDLSHDLILVLQPLDVTASIFDDLITPQETSDNDLPLSGVQPIDVG